MEIDKLDDEVNSIPLNDTSSKYEDLQIELDKVRVAAQIAGTELKNLYDIGVSNLTTHKLFPEIKTEIDKLDEYKEEIYYLKETVTDTIEKFTVAKNEVKQTAKSIVDVSTFQVKNGAIQIPIEIATKDEALQQQLQEIITRLQGYADGRGIVAKVKLTDATADDAANQWAVIEGKFTTVAGEEGKLLAKNKEYKIAMKELATEYQKYLDMGGTNNFSDLTNHKATVKNLTKAYEELCMSVQDTAQQQEKQQSVTASTGIDSGTIQAVTQENKSLETQAEKTSTAIENEAKTAQSASEKFRKLAKEKGNATIANRELAKAAKETADALEREAKARKEAESSRGSKNAVDSNTYSANALEWQRKIKQELLDSGNYAEVYNAKISQTAKGNVSFASSVQTMDGEWKSFTATLDNSGNIVSSKLKDLNEKQVASIERAKEQAEKLAKAYAEMADGESNEPTSYNRSQMENLITEAVEATQALEGLDAKYKAVLNDDGSVTIAKSLTEANGTVKTFTANFEDIQTIIKAANSSVEEFRSVLESAFDSAKVSISTKGTKAETPKVDTSSIDSVTSKYKEIYEVAKKLNSLELKLAGLDAQKNANQIDVLNSELKQTEEIYSRLIAEFWDEKSVGSLPVEDFKKLNSIFEETSKKISEIKAKLADSFVKQGNSALGNFEKKYSGYDGFDKYSAKLDELREKILSISDENGLKEVRDEIAAISKELDDIKADSVNGIKLGTKIEGRTFSDINELKANLVSVLSTIGEVNEQSIKIKGAKSLTAEVKQVNGEIHNMTVNLDEKGFARYVDGGISEFKRLGSAAEGVFKGIKDLVRIYLSPQDFIRYFKQGFDTVTELDTALTELIKVSDASDNEIANYFDEAVVSAKELGTSVNDMISATADWKRNGYSLPDSKKLAETAILYKNVGDGIDIEDATSSIISTLQGFQLESDEAEGIVDKFNAVSNAFSIESGGIGDALQRSAAAFNAANTDLSQSIALITATRQILVEYVETHIKNVFNCHRSLYYFTPQYRGNYYMTV